MKNAGRILLALCLLLTLTGCKWLAAPYSRVCGRTYAVRIDRRLYSFSDQEVPLDEVEVLGWVTACVAEDHLPKADGQSNNPACVNKPFGTFDGQMYIYSGRTWHLCTPMEDTDPCADHISASGSGSYEPYTFIINTDGQVYYCRDEVADVRDVEVQGQITSYLPGDHPPVVGHQSTVPECVGGDYSLLDGHMYLYYSGLWHRCYLPSELGLPT